MVKALAALAAAALVAGCAERVAYRCPPSATAPVAAEIVRGAAAELEAAGLAAGSDTVFLLTRARQARLDCRALAGE